VLGIREQLTATARSQWSGARVRGVVPTECQILSPKWQESRSLRSDSVGMTLVGSEAPGRDVSASSFGWIADS
jgi:hypothetical protein